jgi:hypothetical protein
MPQQEGYIRWASDAKIPLVLSLVDTTGAGVLGASPSISIRRYRETHGTALDGYYWNGTAFVPTPFWILMAEVDAINSPGLYSYIFEQDLVALEWIYLVYYRNLTDPIGYSVEEHIITNEIYIPKTQPDPIVIGPHSILGQLEIVKGLLHHNAMIDLQTYADGQLTSARVRMFDHPTRIPATPGGGETVGLLAEFQISAEYDGQGLNKKYVLKRLYP